MKSIPSDESKPVPIELHEFKPKFELEPLDCGSDTTLASWGVSFSDIGTVEGCWAEGTGWVVVSSANVEHTVNEAKARLPSDVEWHHFTFSNAGKKRVVRLYVDDWLVAGPWLEVLKSKIKRIWFKLRGIRLQY